MGELGVYIFPRAFGVARANYPDRQAQLPQPLGSHSVVELQSSLSQADALPSGMCQQMCGLKWLNTAS
jgi:hypothetical protein